MGERHSALPPPLTMPPRDTTSALDNMAATSLKRMPNQPEYAGPLVFPVPKEAAASEKQREAFTWHDNKEPHLQRRKMILEAHPEIKKLYGPDTLFVYKVGAV